MARKYDILPEQIRRWKKKHDNMVATGALTCTQKTSILSMKVVQTNPKRKDSKHYLDLKLFYENTRNSDRTVTIGMLVNEWRKMNPMLCNTLVITLRHRLYRWIRSENIVHRRVTHIAQNTRHEAKTIDDFLTYINEQIEAAGVTSDRIVHIDETNINFDMISGVTLADRGSRTVSVRKSG